MLNIEALTLTAQEFILTYGIKLIGALALLTIGLWIVNMIISKLGKVMTNVDASLIPFLKSVLNIGMKVAVVITAASVAA